MNTDNSGPTGNVDDLATDAELQRAMAASKILVRNGQIVWSDMDAAMSSSDQEEFNYARIVLDELGVPVPDETKIVVRNDGGNKVVFFESKKAVGYLYRITFDPTTSEIVQRMMPRD